MKSSTEIKLKKVVKTPMVMQMEVLECGAACLVMILAYYKKWIPLEQARLDCDVSRDGSNAKNIIRAAVNYGLIAKGYKYEIEHLKSKGVFPCIVHWNFNHFVVLNGFKRNKVYINDPARGVISVSMEEFDKAFTGIYIKIEPGQNFMPSGKPKSIFSFAKKRLEGTLAPFIFLTFTGLILAIINILNPFYSRMFIDKILTKENSEWLYPLLGFMAATAFLQFILLLINKLYLLKIQGKLSIISNTSFMWHVIRLPINFYSQRSTGDIASRQNSNDGIVNVLIAELAPIFTNLVMLIFYFFVMIHYSVILTMLGQISVISNLFLTMLISKKKINITRVQMIDKAKLTATSVSGIGMIETIKASGAENGFFERWAGYQASVNSLDVKYAKLNFYLGSVPQLIQQLIAILILIIGASLIMGGNFTTGMLIAFQGLMTSFMAPVSTIFNTVQKMQELQTNVERIEDVMNYKPDVHYSSLPINYDNENFTKLSGTFEMKNITFGYSKLNQPLIKNFSMKVDPGKCVALVGASGCGKSTISKLISGLYEPWEGEIYFDKKLKKMIPREVFTGSVSVVDQNITLFEDSIVNNIKMWDSTIEDFEMILASRDANIYEDIMMRDNGFDCHLCEGGRNFSGGQRQRIEIARVLAQDPTILILDEATSALDAKTEYDVVNSIKNRGITCIIIAHRLSTIRDCDEIIVLNQGIAVERGTHDELYNRNGYYSKLVTME